MQQFRGTDLVDWRSLVLMGDDHDGPSGAPPGHSFQKRTPLAPPPVRENRIIMLLRFLLLVMGGFLITSGYYPWHRSLESKSWPIVEGTIVQSALVVDKSKLSGRFERFFYVTRVEYGYTFDKKNYRSDRVEFGLGDQLFLFRDFAQRVVQRYPEGKQVLVAFNPDQPDESVLETTPSAGGSLIFMVMGMLCLAVHYFLGLQEEGPIQSRS
ncbi:MAG: DUF3592 domain-containing protein [Magnetococcales bacterium]|nr:DUF3592 domain-containing protein [Magnetococcales bacterium]